MLDIEQPVMLPECGGGIAGETLNFNP